MLAVATPLINGGALWRIVVASLVGGAGTAIAFGFLLLGLSRASRTQNAGGRFLNYLIASAGAIFCVAAVVLGLYMMAEKPSSKSTVKPAKEAVVFRGHELPTASRDP